MLIENIKEDKYVGLEGEATLHNWNRKVNVTFPDESKRMYAEKCVEFMSNMDLSIMQKLARYAYRYFQEMADILDDEDLNVPRKTSEEDILNYVRPNVIIVEKECRIDRLEFHVECSCDWEIEHGLEITISDGKILYVGGFDDMPPYDEERLEYSGFYDENASMNLNYADKE